MKKNNQNKFAWLLVGLLAATTAAPIYCVQNTIKTEQEKMNVLKRAYRGFMRKMDLVGKCARGKCTSAEKREVAVAASEVVAAVAGMVALIWGGMWLQQRRKAMRVYEDAREILLLSFNLANFQKTINDPYFFVNLKGERGQTLLHKAAYMGVEDALRALIEKGADVNAKDKWGDTPLHSAAIKGSEGAGPAFSKVVNVLIEKGATVNARNKEGETPLHKAASGYKEVVEALLKADADPRIKDTHGKTAADMTNNKNLISIIEEAQKNPKWKNFKK